MLDPKTQVNPWKLTHKGFSVDLIDPKPDTIHPGDIVHSLSQICRWGGHSHVFYSVAQHCVEVAEVASLLANTECMSAEEVRLVTLGALLHDAHEAYIGDIATPIKRVLGNVVRDLEDRIDHAIAARFGLSVHYLRHDIVKQADQILLVTEYRDLMPPTKRLEWLPDERPLLRRLDVWNYDRCRLEFGRVLGHYPHGLAAGA